MSPQEQQQRGVKRKKPPTFPHHPAERARKLKRSWVEVQKIKSKWKAQKRKEGLAAPRPQLEHMVEAAAEDEAVEPNENKDKEAIARSSSAESASTQSEEGSGEEETGEDSADEAPSASKTSLDRPHRRSSTKQDKKSEDKASLRELQKMAYSKSSLHNHKSRPLNRYKGPAASRGRDAGRGGSSRSASRGRGRGQPDMGLRMKAMLEKIKQDFT